MKAGSQGITRIHKMTDVDYERHVGARMHRVSYDIKELEIDHTVWGGHRKILNMMRLYFREVILAAVWSAYRER